MTTTSRAAKDGNGRRKVVRWLRDQRRPCHVCGLPIDYRISDPHDPRHFECDELVPVSLGGSATDRSNVGAAHRFCNEWRGNRMSWSPAAARSAFLAAVAAFVSRAAGRGRSVRVTAQPVEHSRRW